MILIDELHCCSTPKEQKKGYRAFSCINVFPSAFVDSGMSHVFWGTPKFLPSMSRTVRGNISNIRNIRGKDLNSASRVSLVGGGKWNWALVL